ncbi:MAG: flagellar protein export ATPase FliI [bacterium]|nr:flagellar protein export ATPase FliI [bacterium]
MSLPIYLDLNSYREKLNSIRPFKQIGFIDTVTGLTVESIGPTASVGEVCRVYSVDGGEEFLAEVVGFKQNKLILMPIGKINGIKPGMEVTPLGKPLSVRVNPDILGRVLDALGNSIDDLGDIAEGTEYPLDNMPPHPLKRTRIKEIISVGVKAIDGLLTCGKGQRIGIFAGSGVGKSTLLGMIARHSKADVSVIALIGERGREVRDFIEKSLGEEGLKRAVVVVATSDQPPLLRLKAAFTATAIAEYFRDMGKDVILLMDSVTRFAMAQREIGLASGEPPTTKGYTPSVFAILPTLLERAGNSDRGSITGFYTVLVEADDMNEPIADAVRAILDGHIVLSRSIAMENRYPPIDVLASISRVMPDIVSTEHMRLANKIREIMSVYIQAKDLIQIGAYVDGTDPRVDSAKNLIGEIYSFLSQDIEEKFNLEDVLEKMKEIVGRYGY